MEIRYQYEMSDCGSLMRLFRPARWRAMALTTMWLALSLGPSSLVLWAAGFRLGLAVLWAAFAVLMAYVLWLSARQTRNRFVDQCYERTIRTSPEFLDADWDSGWLRCDWAWIRRVEVRPDWICLTRREPLSFVCLIPQRAFGDAGQRDAFVAEVEGYIQQAAPEDQAELVTRPVDRQPTMSVEYVLSDDEVARIAEQSLQPRRRESLLKRSAAFLWLLLALLLLVVLTDGGAGPRAVWSWLAVIVSALLPLPTWRALGALRRRTLRWQVADPGMDEPQFASLSADGVEQRGRLFQALAGWPQITEVIDARRFVAFRTRQHMLFGIPRRAFASEQQADAFLEQAQKWHRLAHQQDEELTLSKPPPLVETGNPYQPPGDHQ